MDTLRERYLKQSFISYLTKWNKDDELAMEAILDAIPKFFMQEWVAHLQSIKEGILIKIDEYESIKRSFEEEMHEGQQPDTLEMIDKKRIEINLLKEVLDFINSKM